MGMLAQLDLMSRSYCGSNIHLVSAVFLAAQSGATLNIVTSKAVHGFNS